MFVAVAVAAAGQNLEMTVLGYQNAELTAAPSVEHAAGEALENSTKIAAPETAGKVRQPVEQHWM